jgi:predicted ATP-dependent Lon-type protease
MPIIYLSQEQCNLYRKVKDDEELNFLLQEVRSVFGDTYLVCEHDRVVKWRWFKRPKTIIVYKIYVLVDDKVGLYNDTAVIDLLESIKWPTVEVNRDFVMAYFYGLLNGRHFYEQQQRKAVKAVL